MNRFLIYLPLLVLIISCSHNDTNPGRHITNYNGYTLVWNDEFDQGSINPENWVHEIGDGTDYGLAVGWGNAELQLYSNDISNSSVVTDDEGNDVLEIRAFSNGQGKYSSAKLTTYQKLSIRYGKIEARIKLPEGQGIWPAFWMLGDNFPEYGWPGCGEIDILELLGHIPNHVTFNAHWVNGENDWEQALGEYTLSEGNFSDDFHVFTLDWTPTKLVYSVDGNELHTIPIDEGMLEFHRSAYLILNVAVGGNWPGNPDETTVFPQVMAVDYVRVYEQNDLQVDVEPAYDPAVETWGVWVDPNLYTYVVNEEFTDFGIMSLSSFGEAAPIVSQTTDAVDGSDAIELDFPGGGWGGLFFTMDNAIDATSYASGHLKFAAKMPSNFTDAEIKLESTGQATFHSVFLVDYTPADLGDGWVEYSIPLSDLSDLDLTDLSIPFAFWNPYDDQGEFLDGTVIIDNLRLTID
jgi:beta-glucanase (GH16 family)